MRQELTIERVVPGGDGLGRVDGLVVLVEGALPGDRVAVDLVPEGRSLARGVSPTVLEPGPHRRAEDTVCPRARDGSCGGCDWPGASLASHEALKRQLVEDALRRLARVDPASIPPIGFLGSPHGYRLRNRLHLDGLGRLGFFAPRSNDASDLGACEIVSPALLERLPRAREAFRSGATPAPAGELTLLEGRDGAPLLGLFEASQPLDDPGRLAAALDGPLDGVLVRDASGKAASRGPLSLTLLAGGAPFRVSVGSFFQGNRFLLDAFLDEVRQAVSLVSDGRVEHGLDLYAGAGFLTRPLLETGAAVEAVEAEPSSAADLAFNLDAWRREGIGARGRAVRGTAEAFVARRREVPDVIVADPPRQGLSKEVRRDLLRLAPRGLVLVSCDPATLARDLTAFLPKYRVARLTLLDLFPQTHHVETVVALAERR